MKLKVYQNETGLNIIEVKTSCLLKIRLYGIFYNCNASDLKILKQLKLSLMRSVWVIWIQSHLPCICILNFYSREISCNILLRPTALYSRDATFMIIIFLKYTLNIVEHKKKWFHTDSRGNKVQPITVQDHGSIFTIQEQGPNPNPR